MRVYVAMWKPESLPNSKGYNTTYVERLARGVREHVPDGELHVVADSFCADKLEAEIREGVVTVHRMLRFGCGGWSNVLEIFHPDHWPEHGGERFMAVGLDTVFVGDCKWLFEWDEHPVGLPLDPFHKPTPCDAVITYDRNGAGLIWSEFLKSRETGMRDHLLFRKPSEMQLLRDLYQRHGWTPLEDPADKLLSYKQHVRRNREWKDGEASIVYFHGFPKPHDLAADNEVRMAWEG